MSKITSRYLPVTLVYKVASLFFTLEKISKKVVYHTICVNYEAKVKLDPEPEPGQSDGSETLYTVLIFCTIKAK